ncbi:hypothetical protein SMACR_04122 [Sordaria macrospora]|uniref:WGS project CABT00000000 data, contig 2.15 n=2 Tax=Sordaria macrospora TaxID=5147 RepID=F7VZE3_SORMK|nr:uncharacterized protein SMAC_04122 [Sordaria macrospora k-hell]KAA8628696.1 hypothetical protein SMACR_04122 [Sordaria macrospora]KAH7635942.1 hypothetical protein B0T09DRAFT_30357 [Sordaria sp. MPI-SDFR-AT-0083]WPJ64415.1 hypothetical protein SMAC4_04122 [Sordaria macrospora]CCC10891.1 unnamed protein product [Sordaria macrospora k-hell]
MLSSSPAIIHQAPPALVQPLFLHNHVLRKKYRDPLKLKQALTKTFGEGNYKIKVRADRWIVAIPREMSNNEIDELENSVYSHY